MQLTWRTDSGPLWLPLPECLQVPPLPTSRQIRSLFRSAPTCLQAEVETGNTCPQDDLALVGPIGFYVTGLFWLRRLGYVPGCIRWWHRCLHRHSHVLHKEVHTSRCTDQNNQNLPESETVDFCSAFLHFALDFCSANLCSEFNPIKCTLTVMNTHPE